MLRDEILGRFDLTDRVAIVTGSSRGIGRAVAEGFAAMGASVVIASRKADACEQAAAEIRSAGGRAVAIPTHVGDPSDLEALVAGTVDEFGSLDIVVNNAATPLAQAIGSMTPEAMAKSWEVNLRGPVLLVQHALEHLRRSQHAAIVNVTTAGVYTHGTYVALYVAAKTAMTAMTRAMAGELAADGIRANALAPGSVRTDMMTTNPVEFQERAVDAQMIKRMADPTEMVPPALFLASDASSFMTGHTLVVDGGMTVH
ncbi:MAG: glucose 1-dehydrogenase [Microthrixaceae bacterium]|nr:glucose 1-dehydrogenase [Microthrixaceae bacterium]